MIWALLLDQEGRELCPRAPVKAEFGPASRDATAHIKLVNDSGECLHFSFGYRIQEGDAITVAMKGDAHDC